MRGHQLAIAAAVVVAVLSTSSLVQALDHCNKYPTCASCVASTWCGWCSTKVVYNNSDPGFHCAGFNPDLPDPFVCYGVYSTKTCQSGWECDTQNYTCTPTAPGTGGSLEQCQANCSTVGKTFYCDNATWTCQIAGAGHGTSLPLCEASCSATHAPTSNAPASSSPSSSSPSSNAPSSNSSAPETPQPTVAPTYTCNTSSLQCVEAGPGRGTSLPLCQALCKKSNHTPSALVGLWRGFPLSQNTVKETDIHFSSKTNTVTFAGRSYTAGCTGVSKVGDSELWLSGCASPLPSTMKCLWETTQTMPETYHAMIACNYQGGDAPTDFVSALSQTGTVRVLLLSRCVPDGYCSFHLGPAQGAFARRLGVTALFVNEKAAAEVEERLSATDPCAQWGANCSYCLGHELCGWCSTNVVYTSGQTGTRCAGFNPNPNATSPFTCTGSYSTEMCYPGWTCEPVNQTCVPAVPGTGIPTKSDCLASCHAKPGPPSLLLGTWRGILINNAYPFGVVVVTINETSIDVSFGRAGAGTHIFSGTLKHVGGSVFITFTDGPHAGTTSGGIYTVNENEVVTYITLALGGDNSPIPTNYKQAMKPPMSELILAKCLASTCHF